MSNLKKVFALSLAIIMCFCMMTTGLAVGTDYTSFTDVGDINYVDAVSLLSALDILKGLPNGSFDPKGDLTRSQLCKMLYVILNNGYDDGATIYKDARDVSLSDIAGHWAEGYIKYCFKRGIVAGNGNGEFLPDAKVTGIQVFKMVLVCLGYDPIKEGYIGTGWASNIAIDAQGAALTDKVETVDMLVPTSREVSSQIVYNGLFATMVHYPNGILTKRLGDDSFTPLTFAWDKLGLKILEGILVANDQVSLRETDSGNVAHGIAEPGYSTFKYRAYSDYQSSISGIIGGAGYTDAFVDVKVKTPYTMVGKSVQAFVKVKPGVRTVAYNWVSGIEKVYGNIVETPGKNIVTKAVNNDYSKDNLTENTKFYINYWDGTDTATTTSAVFTNGKLADKKAAFDSYYKSTARVDDPAASKGQTVWLISNDSNKSVEYVIGFDKRFGEISTYSNDKLTLTKNDSANYKQSYYGVKFEDIYNVADFKQGDRVLMWKVFENENYFLEKPDVLTGTMTGSTGSANEPTPIINGTKYKIARDHISYEDVIANQFVGKELNYFIDNGYIVGVDEKGVTKSPDTYLVVRGSTVEIPAISILESTYKAAVLTSDGSKKTLEIAAIYNRFGTRVNDAAMDAANTVTSLSAPASVKYPTGVASLGTRSINNQVFRYTINSDNKLILYAPDAINDDLANNYEKDAATINMKIVGSKAIDDNTVAFVKNNERNEWYVFTGRTNIPSLQSMSSNEVSLLLGKFAVKNDLVKAMAISNSGWTGVSSTEKYGLVLSSLATVNPDQTWYYKELVIFNGTDIVTYSVKSEVRVGNDILGEGSLVNAGNGRLVKYTLSGNMVDTLEFVDLQTDTRFDAGYIYKSSGGTFTIADYLPTSGTNAGQPVNAHTYMLKSGGKVFLYDGTAEGSSVITDIPAQSLPSFNYNEDLKYTYQAIVELDDSSGLAKTVYIFRDEQELDVDDAAFTILQRMASNAVISPQPIPVGASGEFTVTLGTIDPNTGNAIAWSEATQTSIPGLTQKAGSPTVNTTNYTTTFTFVYTETVPSTSMGIGFKGEVKAGISGGVIGSSRVVVPVILGTLPD